MLAWILQICASLKDSCTFVTGEASRLRYLLLKGSHKIRVDLIGKFSPVELGQFDAVSAHAKLACGLTEAHRGLLMMARRKRYK